MIDGNEPKINVSGNGLSPFQPSPFRDDIKSGLYDYDRSVYEVSPLYHNLQATIKGKPVQIVSFNQRTNSANIRYPNGEKATATLPDNFFYKYDPSTRELARREEIQSKQGLSGADPVGQFVVETAALSPLFKLAGKAIGGVAKKAGEDFITSYVGRLTLRNLPKGVKNRILINLASKTINNANPYVVAGGDDFLYHLLKPVDNVSNNKVPVGGTTVDDVPSVSKGSVFYPFRKEFPRNTSREELTDAWKNQYEDFVPTPDDPINIGYFEPLYFVRNEADAMKKRAMNTLALSKEEFDKLFEAIDAASKKRIYVTPGEYYPEGFNNSVSGWNINKGESSHFNANVLPTSKSKLNLIQNWLHEAMSHATDKEILLAPVKPEVSKAFGLAPKFDGSPYQVRDLYKMLASPNSLKLDYNSVMGNSDASWEMRATLGEARLNLSVRKKNNIYYGDPENQTLRTLLTNPYINLNGKIRQAPENGYVEDYIHMYKLLPPQGRRLYNKRLRIGLELPSVTGGGYLFTQPYLNNNSNER